MKELIATPGFVFNSKRPHNGAVTTLKDKVPKTSFKLQSSSKPIADAPVPEALHKEPLKEGEEEHKKPATKGNVDAELVLYAMKELPKYDKAIIVSGDGDFYCIVEYLAEQGKLLHLMAPNWKYSSLLKPYEQYVVRVDEFKRQLAYKSFRKPAK